MHAQIAKTMREVLGYGYSWVWKVWSFMPDSFETANCSKISKVSYSQVVITVLAMQRAGTTAGSRRFHWIEKHHWPVQWKVSVLSIFDFTCLLLRLPFI